MTGIRAAVACDQDAVPAPSGRGELRWALECLGAAAVVVCRRLGLEHASLRAMINVLTRGRLLDMAPAGWPEAPFLVLACPDTGITALSMPSDRHRADVGGTSPTTVPEMPGFPSAL